MNEANPLATPPAGALVRAVRSDLSGDLLEVSMGPHHPSTHGVFRMIVTLDGETITKLKPVGGFCAETGGAITLFMATALGMLGVRLAQHHAARARRHAASAAARSDAQPHCGVASLGRVDC